MLKQKLSKGSDKFKLKFEKRQQFTRVVWAPSQAAGQDRTRSSSTVTCIRPLNTEQLMYIVGQSFVVVFLLRPTVTGLLHSTAIAYLCTSHIWAFFDPTIDRLIVRCVDQSSRGFWFGRLTWIRLMPLCKSITCLAAIPMIGKVTGEEGEHEQDHSQ